MSKEFKPDPMLLLPRTMESGAFVDLEQAMARWRFAVLSMHPETNGDYVRTVCEEIVRRAELLSKTSLLKFADVANFLLERSQDWVAKGQPVNKIGEKLPKTLGDLGMLKLAEGGRNGEPLDGDELKLALSAPRVRTLQ